MIEIHSAGIARIPFLEALLGAPVERGNGLRGRGGRRPDAVAGWGLRPSADTARQRAAQLGVPYLALEDGFLRSFGTGSGVPTISMVVDPVGIYYDSTRESALERMLSSDEDLLAGIEEDVAEAMGLIREHRLSKYNHVRNADPVLAGARGRKRILIVDQTVGDMSVALGGATADTFRQMVEAARSEHPGALCIVKTHPEVSAGQKQGYLTGMADDADTLVLRDEVNPLALLEQVDHVYVVSSQMGFEALMLGRPVTCFGMPWYAGWGLTQDRQACPRRSRAHSLETLFAAAYFHYTRYLDPVSHRQGSIFDAIGWLLRQRTMAERLPRRIVGVGFRRWKAANIRPMLSLQTDRVLFVPDARRAKALDLGPGDALVHWSAEAPDGLVQLARRTGCAVLRVEDGFVRSVGLGSDLIRPLSLALDGQGMYFDPTRPSDLEQELNQVRFSPGELATARRVRAFMVAHGITKYNLEPTRAVRWPVRGKEVVLVPGQVEDDVSVRLGCDGVDTNLELLRQARRSHPDAYIVYKPHPDVASGNRRGAVAPAALLALADHVETESSVVACIDACDVVHTMTSLSGFDALLRGKRVVTHGRPFYAGWGLTEDRLPIARRDRPLSLDELVAGVLLRYPLYWDWELKGYTTCEAVLNRIVETRDELAREGKLARLRVGYARRQWRKLDTLLRARFAP
ncbi:Capsule polysaccharide biosynthesis protein [compost metagenome]|uniref:capsular polysaccharide biosynthesis protein n=1 Tax=Achromobacter sp. Root83 TaxID=1736602 RepID=UPI00070ADC3E|nr:capsular polysaccharide biosynthesis protein [Achromobacter sp. Root83]KRC79300.1 capsular biosynthesis protein [Achromobacter sp. Root83]